MVNDIIAHMFGLTFLYLPQDPAYTPVPNPSPTIVPIVQPTPVSNESNIFPQLLPSMQQMQQRIMQMQMNQTGGGWQNSKHNILRPTRQEENEPRQG